MYRPFSMKRYKLQKKEKPKLFSSHPCTIIQNICFICEFVGLHIQQALSLSINLTLRTRGLVLLSKSLFAFSYFWNFNGYFTSKWTNTRHICTYLNEFFIVVPNMVMKFHNFDIFYKLCLLFDLSSAHARRIVSVIYLL